MQFGAKRLSIRGLASKAREFTARAQEAAVGSTKYCIGESLNRYGFIVKNVDLRGKRVLDVACGPGHGLNFMASEAEMVVGVDISQKALNTAAKPENKAANAHLARMDAQNLCFAEKSFDVVTSMETLEHVPDPEKMIDEISRVLRPNGTLVLSTPNKAMGSIFGRPYNPAHLREFNIKELLRMLEKNFEEIQVFGCNFVPTGGKIAKARLIATVRSLPGMAMAETIVRGKRRTAVSEKIRKSTGLEPEIQKITGTAKKPLGFVFICRNKKS